MIILKKLNLLLYLTIKFYDFKKKCQFVSLGGYLNIKWPTKKNILFKKNLEFKNFEN